MMDQFKLSWSHGSASIFEDGASIHHLGFDFGDRIFSPFAEAPWQADYINTPHNDHPRHLELLGGEWPCVPFGTSHHDPAHHGFGTDQPWHVINHDQDSITLGIEYPDDHMIKSLRRTITGVNGKTALDFQLTIEPRKTGKLPIGIHPIFKLTDDLNINVSEKTQGVTFPTIFEQGVSILSPNKSFGADGLCASEHGVVDIFAAPDRLKEELVQLTNLEGEIKLTYAQERATIKLVWDKDALPYCLLWISNKGRGSDPWNNRFQGIGVEPVNSFFDINDQAPETGRYGINVTAGQSKTITYRLSAQSL